MGFHLPELLSMYQFIRGEEVCFCTVKVCPTLDGSVRNHNARIFLVLRLWHEDYNTTLWANNTEKIKPHQPFSCPRQGEEGTNKTIPEEANTDFCWRRWRMMFGEKEKKKQLDSKCPRDQVSQKRPRTWSVQSTRDVRVTRPIPGSMSPPRPVSSIDGCAWEGYYKVRWIKRFDDDPLICEETCPWITRSNSWSKSSSFIFCFSSWKKKQSFSSSYSEDGFSCSSSRKWRHDVIIHRWQKWSSEVITHKIEVLM